jgi:hypothetical protein
MMSSGRFGSPGRFSLVALAVSCLTAPNVEAGSGRQAVRRGQSPAVRARAPIPVPTRRVVAPAPSRLTPLGTFRETPYIWVRGNAPAGGGYSPLGTFGDATMVLYGPTSSLRATSAPLLTYTRGYDGQIIPRTATSFSTPNLPSLSPVIYPTQANDYFGFRVSGDPPWWQNGMDWIDQN